MPRRGVLRWRTVKPRKDVYIHVAVMKKKGPRGGRTKAFHVRYVGSKKVKKISASRRKSNKKIRIRVPSLKKIIGI